MYYYSLREEQTWTTTNNWCKFSVLIVNNSKLKTKNHTQMPSLPSHVIYTALGNIASILELKYFMILLMWKEASIFVY